MDNENRMSDAKANSLFQVDGMFLKKILARKSFVGQSKRMLHSETVVSVPFDWELKPGTPKHPQSEIVGPIKPPPSVQSQTLGSPSFASTHTTMSCFWKKSRKNHLRQGKKAKPNDRRGHIHGNTASKGNKNAPESLEFSDVNVDSTSSSDHSRSSSSSSSSLSNSSSNSASSSSGLRSFAKGLVKWSF